jgi:hypothetical protein
MKYLQSDTIFSFLKEDGTRICVVPVDGEVHYNDVGFSAGFVHFADPETGLKLGFCGIDRFETNADETGGYEGLYSDLFDIDEVTPLSGVLNDQALTDLAKHFKGMLPSSTGIPQLGLLLIHELRETRKALEKA